MTTLVDPLIVDLFKKKDMICGKPKICVWSPKFFDFSLIFGVADEHDFLKLERILIMNFFYPISDYFEKTDLLAIFKLKFIATFISFLNIHS